MRYANRSLTCSAGNASSKPSGIMLDFVNAALDVVQDTIGTSLDVTTEVGWLALFAGDALLIAGSLLPGI